MGSHADTAPAGNQLSPEERGRIEREKTRLLFENLPLSVATTLMVAGILAFAMRDQVSVQAMATWIAAMIAICGFRLALWHARRRDAAADERHKTWQAWFEAGAFGGGCVWGIASMLLFGTESLAHQVFLGFVLASIAAGGISTLAVEFKSYVIFLIPTLMPYSIRLFIEGGELQVFMGSVFVLGLGFLLVNARRFGAVTDSSLTLSLHNTRLVAALRSALHEAEDANRAKTRFLAKMSHEIRTPLNSMMGLGELLLKTPLTDQQRHLGGTINQSANSLLTMVGDLLDISRIDCGNFVLDSDEFEPRACIEDAIGLCAVAGYRKGLEVHLIIEQRLPRRLVGDAKRLNQVLINLIGNAVRLTDVGQVTLRVSCARSANGTYDLSFAISDNGIGIPRKDLERLFEPLTTMEMPSQSQNDGADLSLALTRHLVDLMGGRVSLSSEIGKGTTVSFKLEMQASVLHPAETESEIAALAGKRVMVFDDRPLSREAIASRITTDTALIEQVCSEAECLSKLRRAARDGAPYHLLIVDRVRPRTDNFALHRLIVEAPELSATRVIALMPVRWSLDEATAREFRAGSFVSKPLRRANLVTAIQTALAPQHATSTRHGDSAALETTSTTIVAANSPIRGRKILLAEDNPINQEVALAYLAGFGCSTALANNGLEAIYEFERGPYDIVLMDCQMPELDGLSAIRHIRQQESARGMGRTPIVVVTANAFASDRQQAMDAGADSFLAKPFSETQLLQAMESCLTRIAA